MKKDWQGNEAKFPPNRADILSAEPGIQPKWLDFQHLTDRLSLPHALEIPGLSLFRVAAVKSWTVKETYGTAAMNTTMPIV